MPKKTHVGNDRSQGTADVPRRSNRSEEIYKAGAQRLVTPTTPRADRPPAVSEIEVGAIVKVCRMPARKRRRARSDDAARAGVGQASREETAACPDAVRGS